MIFGMLPLLKPDFKANFHVLGLIKALTGGIFIAIAMIGIVPHSEEGTNKNINIIFVKTYPWNSFATISGFFFILFLDKIL